MENGNCRFSDGKATTRFDADRAAATSRPGHARHAMHPPRPSLFSVELRTSRWAEMVEWYRAVLGLRVLLRVIDDEYALIEAGDTRLAILGRQSPGDASPRWSLGFEVGDLEAVRARLAASGTAIDMPGRNPEGFREIVVADPDGNRLRLFAWQN